jgi:hypothetical protein
MGNQPKKKGQKDMRYIGRKRKKNRCVLVTKPEIGVGSNLVM